MKHFKRIFILLFTGFIAFAPPGTLLFVAILILGLLGKRGFLVVSLSGLLLLAIVLIARRNIAKRVITERDVNRHL